MTNTPEVIDLLIEARWVATVESDTVLKNHAVAIDKGRIKAILPASEARPRYSPRTLHVLPDHILIPGLINLHTHAAMSLMRGIADDLPLMAIESDNVGGGEIINIASRRKPVTYTIHITQLADGKIETAIEDVSDAPDTDKVMHLLTLIVNAYRLKKYAEYIAANMPDDDQ